MGDEYYVRNREVGTGDLRHAKNGLSVLFAVLMAISRRAYEQRKWHEIHHR